MELKICPICNLEFEPYNSHQKICSFFCRDKQRIERLNRQWKEDKTEKKEKTGTTRIATAYLYKKNPTWMKRFQAMRG